MIVFTYFLFQIMKRWEAGERSGQQASVAGEARRVVGGGRRATGGRRHGPRRQDGRRRMMSGLIGDGSRWPSTTVVRIDGCTEVQSMTTKWQRHLKV
jgi:hypothetical protein